MQVGDRVRSRVATNMIWNGVSVSLFAGATGTIVRMPRTNDEWIRVRLDKQAPTGATEWPFLPTELVVLKEEEEVSAR